MRVNIPFLFPAVIVEDDEQVQTFEGDWAELEIPDASDAPRVCVVEGYTGHGFPYEIDIRKVGDRFYRPKLAISSSDYFPLDDGSDRMSTHNLGSLVRTYHFCNGNDQKALPDRLDQIVRFINRPDRRVLAWDGRAEAIAAIEHAIRDLVVVDGQVWEPCGEPRICVELFWSPPTVSVVFKGTDERPANGVACIFPIDQAEAALAMVEEASMDQRLLEGQQQRPGGVLENRRPWTAGEVAVPTVTYVDPDAVGSRARDAVVAARTALSDILARTPLENYRRPLINAWLDFRDAVGAAEVNPDDWRMDELFHTWQATTNAIEREPPQEVERIGSHARMRSRYEMEAYRNSWRRAVGVGMAAASEQRHLR
ncbi:hypothetical protein OIU34_17295 [Pararhizobium sp. BT-229]|uniref:hypothetical protein n=1 Tax=Pararhizobium sp. BT-229 TaxID=2986923 RepID=UPI0021F6F070|nr:hypothetical protein [Pararhizobium sp. BT-229]MCV9963658.1 hypothetical protein [Pararhizobium sp. BT-229]